MEISYLCAARISDVLCIKHSQLLTDGIFIKQGKTGKKQIKKWTNRLRDIVNYAHSIFPPINNESYLILSSDNDKYSYSGFDKQWQDAKRKASEKLGYKVDFTFHDLKAKGISDFEGSTKDKQLFSGHKTESQVLIYDRLTKVTPSLDIPKSDKM